MIFNKKFLHALEAVLDISIHSSNSPIRAEEITKRQGIPTRYLEKILQELVRENILKGSRGPNGGYTLAREKRNIYLIDIYKIILSIERNKKEEIETQIRLKVINPFMSKISNEIISSLKSTSIEDLHKKIREIGFDVNNKNKIDFTI